MRSLTQTNKNMFNHMLAFRRIWAPRSSELQKSILFVRDEADFNGPRPWEGLPTPKLRSLTPTNQNISNHMLGLLLFAF